ADQVLVIDGGSDDNTCQFAQELGAEVIAAVTRGRGRQQAWGVAHATGDLIVFLHADSYFEANAFLPLREFVATQLGRPVWVGFIQRIMDARCQYRVLVVCFYLTIRSFSQSSFFLGLLVSTETLKQDVAFFEGPVMAELSLSR